ncbi:MAG: phosphate:acyl-(acyl carrier protein) acyltransferase [Capsulimonas sp.]|nr:phosphate:acyl-(acyl carrier protein) acyltransferase [Capsulimonas sp.]
MKIAVDAMGGDYAPVEVVKGALSVAREDGALTIILVGDEAAIRLQLASEGDIPSNITIEHTTEVIEMSDHPASAVRKKRNSSLVVCGQMVKSGRADATISAGNTGAAMAVAALDLGRIPGIERPAIAASLPTAHGATLLVDAGANVDCSPQNLLQFALLGSVYAEKVMGVASPRVGLLNIGGEAGKGNELTKTTYALLAGRPLNFIGNVEGKDVFEHAADVVVCDGFAGNVLLKTGEAVAEYIVTLLSQEAKAGGQATVEAMRPPLKRLLSKIDYAETGGAPLLGVNGVSFISHGRSRAKAIASAIRAAAKAAGTDYVSTVRDAVPKFSEDR